MKSIGEVLQSTREKLKIDISVVVAHTHIKQEYLEALEKNEFYRLPSPAAAQGFLQTYARFLGIDTQHALAILRRDFEIYKDTYVPVLSVIHTEKTKKRLGRVVFFVIGVILVSLIVGGYGYWTYHRLTKPPELYILTPDNDTVVTSPVVVRGITSSDANVEINGEPVGMTQDGEFAGEVELQAGESVISVTAKNRKGTETVMQVKVSVKK